MIGNSPRRRHHIRFWAAHNDADIDIHHLFDLFRKKQKNIDITQPTIWIGSGTKDTGLRLTPFTYQIIHSTDKNVDEERDYILQTLQKNNSITDIHLVNPNIAIIGTYVSDGKITIATLR